MSKRDYIDEKLLAATLIKLKNASNTTSMPNSHFIEARNSYIAARRNVAAQLAMFSAAAESPFTDDDSIFLYTSIKQIVYKYFSGVNNHDDIISETYLKLLANCTYDYTRTNSAGKRCSAFAYLTQIIKNAFYYDFNKNKRFVSIDENIRLIDDIYYGYETYE